MTIDMLGMLIQPLERKQLWQQDAADVCKACLGQAVNVLLPEVVAVLGKP